MDTLPGRAGEQGPAGAAAPAVERRAIDAYRARFNADAEVVGSAPGRVNLIGEHTDYNGGFVLPFAIDRQCAVAAGSGTGGLYSEQFGDGAGETGSWTVFPRGVERAFREADYVVGPLQAAFTGNVPIGAGLSSSAAIEVATAVALRCLYDLDVSGPRLAQLCQWGDHHVVGVKSGIMDQYISLMAQPGTVLLLDTRSLQGRYIPFDPGAAGLAVLVCDTGVKRDLAATGYNQRREACERAAARLGLPDLRDATEESIVRLQGEEGARARHVVSENRRVINAAQALEARDFTRLGQLMDASHASLRDDYEVSTRELDTFVNTARAAGALGARLTGAGFGGSAIALMPVGAVAVAKSAVRTAFQDQDFRQPTFYAVTPSAGAHARRYP